MAAQLTDRWLRKEYLKLNRRWFDGKLPRNTVVKWCDSFPKPDNGVYGRTVTYRASGTKPGAPIIGFGITISRRAERSGMATVMVTLLHEMAHVKTWRSSRAPHGRVWVMEMRRLAAAGAFDKLW